MEDQANKVHRKSKVGKKAEKKDAQDKKKRGLDTSRHNAKAFAIRSGVKAAKQMQRRLDKEQKKLHAPAVDRTPVIPAPYFVAVVGPSGVGKTTLIRSLVKRYTKQNITDVTGPVTVVTGKNRRLTFFECPNELNAMIDVAKVADLVLLMIDGYFGFEMETFEFLNVLQAHGFPKVMGILTHLDQFKNAKTLRNTKKRLKQRFWTEVCDGAKVFYLSGLINGKYHRREILNLSRFLAVMKFRPLIWKNTHPFVVVDRVEELTEPEDKRMNPKCDRRVCLYGYVRGTYLRKNMKVHLIGAGDFAMSSIEILDDPCPLPEVSKKKRSLNEKETLLFAPMSDVGALFYDKDAVYINIPQHHVKFSRPEDFADTTKEGESDEERNMEVDIDEEEREGVEMVRTLQATDISLDERMRTASMPLFSNSKPLTQEDAQKLLSGSDSMTDVEQHHPQAVQDGQYSPSQFRMPEERRVSIPDLSGDGVRVRRKAIFGDTEDLEADTNGSSSNSKRSWSQAENSTDEEDVDSSDVDLPSGWTAPHGLSSSEEDGEDEEDEEEEEEEGALRWKSDLGTKALASFRQRERVNLQKLVYDAETSEEEFGGQDSDSDSDSDGELFKVRKSSAFLGAQGRLGAGSMAGGMSSTSSTSLSRSEDATRPSAAGGETFLEGFEHLLRPPYDDVSKGGLLPETLQKWNTVESDLLQTLREKFQAPWDAETGGSSNSEVGENETEDDGGEESHSGSSGSEDEEEDSDGGGAAKRRKLKEEKKKAFDNAYDKKGSDGEEDEDVEGSEFLRSQEQRKQKQALVNAAEFEEEDPNIRARYEGFRPGVYVRVELEQVPCEFIENLNGAFPIVMGGLQANEEPLSLMQVRIKRHRWYHRILKTFDPLIFSIGWRRFQSLPVYSTMDQNGRHRMLKYTPQHMHCYATFYGPVTPPNTGLIAFESLSNKMFNFRVSATGVVLHVDKTFNIVKKLKLVGYPFKIFKNTALIKDMFNTPLEAAKFMSASIRTVSGVRGQIKKVAKEGPPGTFRATFEDKILMSDIVFLRSWYPVKVPKLYNPVFSLLQPVSQVEGTRMRSVRELRQERDLTIPVNPDSLYKPIERHEREFSKLRIPKTVEAALPFKLKTKALRPKKRKTLEDKRRAVILDPEEKKAQQLLREIATVKNQNVQKRLDKQAERKRVRAAQLERENSKRQVKDKEKRRERYRSQGLKELRSEEAAEKAGARGRRGGGGDDEGPPTKRSKQ